MGKFEWRTEREELERVLSDLKTGKVTLKQGYEDCVAQLKRRIANLEEKLSGSGR